MPNKQIVALAAAAAVYFFSPTLGVLVGCFSGWVVSVTFGNWVVAGASALGLQIQTSNLADIGAALGFFGGFFRTAVSKHS